MGFSPRGTGEYRRSIRTRAALVAAVLVISLLAAGCTTGQLSAGPGTGTGPGDGQGPVGGTGPGNGRGPAGGTGSGPGDGGGSAALLPQADAAPLLPSEAADLLFLREEEQLAHDLYVRWSGLYTVPVFSTIADSETTHLGQVQLLIDRYRIAGRIGNATAGYTDPAIQALYNDLGPKGDVSLSGAFSAGLAVEEHDIADIDRMAANTTRADLLQVYANLRQGSENHRSAFLRQSGR